MSWPLAFLCTVTLELPCYAAALRGRRLLATVLAANVLTHPALWVLWPAFASPVAALLVLECGAILAETLVIAAACRRPGAPLPLGPSFATSCAANVISTVVGLALGPLIAG